MTVQGCPIAVRQPSWGQVWCVGPGEVEQSYLHSHGHREWLRAMPKGENPPGTANGFEPCPDANWACDTPPMEKGARWSEGRRGEDRGGRNGGCRRWEQGGEQQRKPDAGDGVQFQPNPVAVISARAGSSIGCHRSDNCVHVGGCGDSTEGGWSSEHGDQRDNCSGDNGSSDSGGSVFGGLATRTRGGSEERAAK